MLTLVLGIMARVAGGQSIGKWRRIADSERAFASGTATKIVNRTNCLIPFTFKPMCAQGANSHCVCPLDSVHLVYISCVRYARPSEPHQTLRRRAQLPFPHCTVFLRSMVSSWHALGTLGHLWQ